MTICALGDVAFSVTNRTAAMLSNMQWNSSANYSTHALAGKKGLIEFTGMEPDEISFELELSAFFGLNPDKQQAKLTTRMAKAQAMKLIIGDKVFPNKWVIESLNRTASRHYKDGTVASYSLSITLKEDVN